jgi:hypothetical protein
MRVDFSELGFDLAQKVDEILRGTYNRQLLEAAEEQRRVAALNYLHPPRARDGFGEQTLAIHPVFDAYWRQCYGARYSEDKSLLKFLCRRNPEIVVRSLGTRVQVGWEPNKRFVRRYSLGNGKEQMANGKGAGAKGE